MKKSIIVILLGILFLCGCSKSEYKIAVINEYPPYFYDDNGKYKGMYIDILDIIADKRNFNYRIVKIDKNEIEEKLDKNDVDAVFSNNIEDDKLKFGDSISNTKVRVASYGNDNSVEDLKYKKIGILKNSYIKNFVYKIRNSYGYAVTEYESVEQLAKGLTNNEIDKIVEEDRVILYLANNYGIKFGKEVFNTESIVILINKRSVNFEKDYNLGLVELINSGEFTDIKTRYTSS